MAARDGELLDEENTDRNKENIVEHFNDTGFITDNVFNAIGIQNDNSGLNSQYNSKLDRKEKG
jgi:hypothetical protein